MQETLAGWQGMFGLPVSMAVRKTDGNNSDRSVADTVALMGVHAINGSKSKQVARAIEQAGCLIPNLTNEKALQKVFSYIKGRVKFVEDESVLVRLFKNPNSKELLVTPEVILSMNNPRGDCDDFSMLCCSMLLALGIPCSFVTIAADSKMPEQFTHVYCISGNIPMDCSHGKQVGWESPKIFRKQIWPVINWNEKGRDMGRSYGDGQFYRAQGMRGLGDESDTGNSDISLQDLQNAATPGDFWSGWFGSSSGPVAIGQKVPVGSTPNIWNQITPGIFTSLEKILQQTTQQPGYQTTGPNGQSTSYVLGPGQSAANITSLPGLTTASSGLIPIAIGGVVLFALFKMMSK